MILPRTQAQRVAAGQATLAILPIYDRKPKGVSWVAKSSAPRGTVWIMGEWRNELGKLERTPYLCQVTVGDVERHMLHEVDLRTAVRAGFQDCGALARWWRERYQRVEPPASEEPWPDYLPVPVWVAELSLDVTVFLKPGAGFTTEGMDRVDAGACVPDDYADYMSREAEARDSLRRLAKQRNELVGRLEKLFSEADKSGQDVTRLANHLERQIAQYERKLRARVA